MANPEDKSFHCDLIDPTGKLLDRQVTSVVLPAHDGQLGILYDHMPMLCQLGLGLMKVTPAAGPHHEPGSPRGGEGAGELSFFIDGGCALVAQNTVTVIAYDALALQDVKAEQIRALIDATAKSVARADLPAGQRTHQNERLRALQGLMDHV